MTRIMIDGDKSDGSLIVSVGAVIGFFTWEWFKGDFIGGLLAGAVGGGLVLLVRQLDYWRKYRKPWYTEWEPRRGEVHRRIDIQNSDEQTLIQLRLRFTARVHVSHIRFQWEGGGNTPKILELYDWNTLPDQPLSANVYVESNDRGAWYWHYHNQFLRTPGARHLQNTIHVGLKIQTQGAYQGVLSIQLGYDERMKMPKSEMLPVFVTLRR